MVVRILCIVVNKTSKWPQLSHIRAGGTMPKAFVTWDCYFRQKDMITQLSFLNFPLGSYLSCSLFHSFPPSLSFNPGSVSPRFGSFMCTVAHRLLIKKIHLFRVTAWFFIKNKLPAFREDIWASWVPLMTIFPASPARLGSPCLSPRVAGPGRTMRVTVK